MVAGGTSGRVRGCRMTPRKTMSPVPTRSGCRRRFRGPRATPPDQDDRCSRSGREGEGLTGFSEQSADGIPPRIGFLKDRHSVRHVHHRDNFKVEEGTPGGTGFRQRSGRTDLHDQKTSGSIAERVVGLDVIPARRRPVGEELQGTLLGLLSRVSRAVYVTANSMVTSLWG